MVRASFRRLGSTFRQLRQYRQLLRFLIAFLIYADGIGTIIGVAAIYGAELGFGMTELILALLLVQFVGIPFTLMFGSIPGDAGGHERRRAVFVAFVLFNLVALPLVGILGRPGPGRRPGGPLPARLRRHRHRRGPGRVRGHRRRRWASTGPGEWWPGTTSAAGPTPTTPSPRPRATR